MLEKLKMVGLTSFIALNTLKCNDLTSLDLKGLNRLQLVSITDSVQQVLMLFIASSAIYILLCYL